MFDSWKTTVQLVLIVGWILGSTLVWAKLLEQRLLGLPLWEPSPLPARRIPAGLLLGTIFPAQWDPKLGIHVT